MANNSTDERKRKQQEENTKVMGAVRRLYSEIAPSIEPKGHVLNKLYEDEIITNAQIREIEELEKNRASRLLEILFQTRHPTCFLSFKESLKHEYNWIVKKIEQIIENDRVDAVNKRNFGICSAIMVVLVAIISSLILLSRGSDTPTNRCIHGTREWNSGVLFWSIWKCRCWQGYTGNICETAIDDLTKVERVDSSEIPPGAAASKGLAWLDNRIYVTGEKSPTVYVFSAEPPYKRQQDEEFDLEGIESVSDMTASAKDMALFVCDYTKRVVIRIQMPGKQRETFQISGNPYKMSITSSNLLLVLVGRGDLFEIDIYKTSNFQIITKVDLPREVKEPRHVVQLSTDNFYILYGTGVKKTGELHTEYQLREMTKEGKILRHSSFAEKLKLPNYLATTEQNELLIADFGNNKIYITNKELNSTIAILGKDELGFRSPRRIYYIGERRLIVVGDDSKGQTAIAMVTLNTT